MTIEQSLLAAIGAMSLRRDRQLAQVAETEMCLKSLQDELSEYRKGITLTPAQGRED